MYNNNAMKKKKKIIEITILSIIVIWALIFIIDYIKYKNSSPPLIVISKKTTEFQDGTVDEYFSIGWVYREYKRKAIGDIELTPLWKKMQKPAAKGTLPEPEQGYEVPDNPEKKDEFKGIIYYYRGGSIVGTYKCLNTDNDCTKAISGKDEYDIKSIDPLTKLEEEPKFNYYNGRYAFIDDSLKQYGNANEKQATRVIYLYDISNNKILAQYKNIKYSTINENKNADGAFGRFIVQNNDGKWGVIEPTPNEPKIIVDFEFDSINYNEKTQTYIVKKDNKWHMYNAETKELSNGFDDIILEAYTASGNTFVKTVKLRKIGQEIVNNYYLYNINGNPLITQNNIVSIQIFKEIIAYTNNNNDLKIIDLQGNAAPIDNLKVNYNSYVKTDSLLPAYNIEINFLKEIIISIPKTNNISSICDIYRYDIETWKFKGHTESKCDSAKE